MIQAKLHQCCSLQFLFRTERVIAVWDNLPPTANFATLTTQMSICLNTHEGTLNSCLLDCFVVV